MSNKIVVQQTCVMCNDQKKYEMTEKQFEDLKEGKMHIQAIFPRMNADDRERFISGICGSCFDKTFGDE